MQKSFLLALSLLAAGTTAAQPQEPPPGMVLVRGGRTTIGTNAKDMEALIRANPDAGGFLAAETPQHQVEVEDFFLMTTEVTNEQYAAFVRVSGTKPPHLWGQKALDEARAEFLRKEGEERRAATARGERVERKTFDEAEWWDRNWQGAQWEVPESLLAHPVTYVDFENARSYAKWAGVRLMSEQEFVRAARGDGDGRFPWGDEWKEGMAATLEAETTGTLPVASFAGGAVGGVYDLAGNVWEWTSSPFVPFEGYEVIKIKVDRDRTVEAVAPFDASERVLVGGSHSTPQAAARVAYRQGTLRRQASDAIGFRCAASPQPGLDAANAILERDVALNVLPEDLEFDPAGAIVARHWTTSPGTAGSPMQLEDGKRKKGRLERYAVIERYDQVLFVPATKTAAGSLKDLGKLAEEVPVYVGFLSTTIPLAQPALEPGTYFVGWRQGGKSKAAEGEGAIDWTQVAGYAEKDDQFVFFDLGATPIAAVKALPMLYDRQRDRGSVTLEPFVPPTAEDLERLEQAGKPAPTPLDTVRIHPVLPGKSRGKAFLMDLPLLVAPEVAPSEAWRLGA